MRVVIAAHGFLPSIGGVSTTVSILAQAFADEGHDVTVVTLTPGPVNDYGYNVIRKANPLKIFDLYRRADLIVQSNLALKLIYPLLLIRRPFALQHHSESAFRLSKSIFSLDFLRRDVLSRARHFVTSKYIGEVSGLPEYEVTPPFANPRHITPEIVREPAGRRGVLFVGRLEPEKGVDFMLDRWPAIRDRLHVNELRIVGKGSLERSIEARISRGQADGVTLVGPLQRQETALEMARAAYILVPSLWDEPFGAVALEGVAAGAIIVVAKRGGLGEAAGELGIMFDPDDDGSFNSALDTARTTRERLLASPNLWNEYRKRMDCHLAKFQPSSVANKIIDTMLGSREKRCN